MPVTHEQFRYKPNEHAIIAAVEREHGNAEALSHEN
jgi:hypothetical protein